LARKGGVSAKFTKWSAANCDLITRASREIAFAAFTPDLTNFAGACFTMRRMRQLAETHRALNTLAKPIAGIPIMVAPTLA